RRSRTNARCPRYLKDSLPIPRFTDAAKQSIPSQNTQINSEYFFPLFRARTNDNTEKKFNRSKQRKQRRISIHAFSVPSVSSCSNSKFQLTPTCRLWVAQQTTTISNKYAAYVSAACAARRK